MPKRAPLKILIVDDFDMIRMLLKKSLTEIGFSNFEEACDGDQGLQLLNEAHDSGKPFDLVFLDWNMPKVTGIAFLETCRQIPHFQQIPIIMITSRTGEKHRQRAFEIGVQGGYTQPFGAISRDRRIGDIVAASL